MSEFNTVTIESPNVPAPHAYNNWAFQPIIHQHMNKLRARLMNLAETSTRDKQQCDAMKGLMKDFLNEAYFPCMREIEYFLRDYKVIPEGEDQSGIVQGSYSLDSKGIDDYLYEAR